MLRKCQAKISLGSEPVLPTELAQLVDFAVKNELMERAERVSERVPQKTQVLYIITCTSLV